FNPRFQRLLAGALLAFSLLLLPGLIFLVCAALLGRYGASEDGGIGSFYADFFSDLGSVSLRAWLLALGPALRLYALRALFFQRTSPAEADEPPTAPRERPIARSAPRAPTPAARRPRVEPRLSRD